jgi:hypothetical protein
MECLSTNTHGVTVLATRFLPGPNLYAYMPIKHVSLDIGPYERLPSTSLPVFLERISA